MITAKEIIEKLGLKPHPAEGGFFIETYRSEETVPEDRFGGRYTGPRSVATAIYYLLTPETYSAMHRLQSDEIFHFYLGDPVQMLQLCPGGEGRTVVMGSDLLAGMAPQVIVPRGVWQGSRLIDGGRVALLGTTVSPGFEFEDYETGRRETLAAAYPEFRGEIERLTRH